MRLRCAESECVDCVRAARRLHFREGYIPVNLNLNFVWCANRFHFCPCRECPILSVPVALEVPLMPQCHQIVPSDDKTSGIRVSVAAGAGERLMPVCHGESCQCALVVFVVRYHRAEQHRRIISCYVQITLQWPSHRGILLYNVLSYVWCADLGGTHRDGPRGPKTAPPGRVHRAPIPRFLRCLCPDDVQSDPGTICNGICELYLSYMCH